MKYKDFRNFRITRNCTKEFTVYNDYLPYLRNDFKCRCAYCNTLDTLINENYRVDHYIPQSVVKGTDMEKLILDYNNLMYCCPKCNLVKSSKYEGDIHDGRYNNELFYNPVDVDYNDIFYRNEYGGISSEDKKGKEMIINLKLYSPVYNLAFLIEEISDVLSQLEKKICEADDLEKKDYYNKSYISLNKFLMNIRKLFNCSYYSNSIRNDN